MTSQAMIRVAVIGALGKMGQEVVKTVLNDDALTLVAAIDPKSVGEDIGPLVGYGQPANVFITDNLESTLANHLSGNQGTVNQPIDVAVDFTHPSCVMTNAKICIDAGVRPVIGTTGLTAEELEALEVALKAKNIGGLVIPNFSIGAVLLMKFAAEACRYFDHAEIIELHHNQKADAPSGTSLHTAALMAQARQNKTKEEFGKSFGASNATEKEVLPGARGATTDANLHIHSVRLPGLIAHEEVLFGAPGELLTLRHDSTHRSCFMPGVALAIKKVMACNGLTVGLEHLL